MDDRHFGRGRFDADHREWEHFRRGGVVRRGSRRSRRGAHWVEHILRRICVAKWRVVVASTGTANASAFGSGRLTINGGTIGTTAAFGLNQGIANTIIDVNGDFAINPAGRIMFGGTWDLGSATRSVTSTRTMSALSAITAGANTSWGLATVASVAPAVANGTLRIARDPASSNYVCFRLSNSPTFADNTGLVIGANVITVFGSDLTNADPTLLPELTIESRRLRCALRKLHHTQRAILVASRVRARLAITRSPLRVRKWRRSPSTAAC